MAHTQGPWGVERHYPTPTNRPPTEYWQVYDQNSALIATVEDMRFNGDIREQAAVDATNAANATLIAAAPDLYAALHDMLYGERDQVKALAALEKARG